MPFFSYFMYSTSSNYSSTRSYLILFLSLVSLHIITDDSEIMLEYCVAVETLKSCDILDRHRLASEIYNKYIASSVSIIRLEKPILKGMEAFIMGESGSQRYKILF